MCLVSRKVAPFYPSSSQIFDVGRGVPGGGHPMWHIAERFLTIRDGSMWIFEFHLIILITLTVKLSILTLFEMIFWNCRDNCENKVERASLTLFETTRITSETILKTMSLKHAF